ncbi:MAG TPA: DnaJ domain-containing protein [Sphingomicrobium sp.]
MNRPSTYYELFGVSRSANSEEIRAAYVALMKQYHPDAAGPGDAAAEHTVALINRCYAVLKDPLKRAEYDAKLAHKPRRAEALPRRRAMTVVPPPRRMSQRRWVVLLVAIGAAGAALATQLGNEWTADPGSSAGTLFGWSAAADSAGARRPLPSREVGRALKLATTVSTEQALTVSRDCFEAARAQADAGSAQLCIIFDDAVLYWRQNASDYAALPLYYREEVMRMRHLSALGLSGSQAEKRLDELRDTTFHGLLAQLARNQEASDKTARVAAAAPASSPPEAKPSRNSQSQIGTNE